VRESSRTTRRWFYSPTLPSVLPPAPPPVPPPTHTTGVSASERSTFNGERGAGEGVELAPPAARSAAGSAACCATARVSLRRWFTGTGYFSRRQEDSVEIFLKKLGGKTDWVTRPHGWMLGLSVCCAGAEG
jgi:hypothetical protein